ncbi:hypothetical protein LEMLEM_LOCUS15332 [Lemmus lemmus]
MKKMYLLSSLSRPQDGKAGWPQVSRRTKTILWPSVDGPLSGFYSYTYSLH